jgi:RimJ/RimL family protein N-acetyltransferase
MASLCLANGLVTLEPANSSNIDLLIEWTFDPVAQGPYKRVPSLSAEELRHTFLFGQERQYFMIRRADTDKPLGRFYWRPWRFDGAASAIDWELNILLADPANRGNGFGSAVQRLAAEYLATLRESKSVFAFTLMTNEAERRALLKAGFIERGELPQSRYPVALPEDPCVLFVWPDARSPK